MKHRKVKKSSGGQNVYSEDLIESKYWESLTLVQMNTQQWEAICDGCARCCLHKFVDDDSSSDTQVYFTNIACKQLNDRTCACSSYENRKAYVPDCVSLSKENLASIDFLPPSCSYRRMNEGKGLASWHPLLNQGKKTRMHELGISVRNKVVAESDAALDDFENHIVTWPLSQID